MIRRIEIRRRVEIERDFQFEPRITRAPWKPGGDRFTPINHDTDVQIIKSIIRAADTLANDAGGSQ